MKVSSVYTTRTYRLRGNLASRVRRLATELGVHDSELICCLLTHALADVAAGRLVIRRRPVVWEIDTSEDGAGRGAAPSG